MKTEACRDLAKQLIRDVKDFPKPGITFKDITPLLRTPGVWRDALDVIRVDCMKLKPDILVGIEARGFIIGAALANHMNLGFVPARKAGKLPGPVKSVDYDLEYGKDRLEISEFAIGEGHRVVVVDDVLATGGTAAACAKLISACGAELVGYCFLVELGFLKGRSKLPRTAIQSFITF